MNRPESGVFPARQEDRAACMALFAKVFGDPLRFVEGVFDWFFTGESCLAFYEEGRPVSMVFYPSVPVGPFSAGYIYGACTEDAFRGGGRMGRLMEEALARMKRRGDAFAFLVPASESLVAYYARFGFAPGFYERRGVFRAETNGAAPARLAAPGDFPFINALYEEENKNALSIGRNAQFYEKYQALAASSGFFVCPDGYAFVDDSDGFSLREAGGDFAKTAAAVLAALDLSEIKYRLSAETKTPGGETRLYGCVAPLSEGFSAKPLRLGLLWD